MAQSQLQTLIGLAEQSTDAAAKRVGAATRAVQEAEQKLQMLHGFRDDYAQRLQQQGSHGMSPHAYRNYLGFMQKLEVAINGQQDVIRMAEQRLQAEQHAWQEAEKKRLSYQTLDKRAQQRAQQKELKRDQRAMDEFAARQAFYKR